MHTFVLWRYLRFLSSLQSQRLTQIRRDLCRENVESCSWNAFTPGQAQIYLRDCFELYLCLEVVQKGNRKIIASSPSAAKSAVVETPKNGLSPREGTDAMQKHGSVTCLPVLCEERAVNREQCVDNYLSSRQAVWSHSISGIPLFAERSKPPGTDSQYSPMLWASCPGRAVAGVPWLCFRKSNPFYISSPGFLGGTMWFR